jgi:hypothetical protein
MTITDDRKEADRKGNPPAMKRKRNKTDIPICPRSYKIMMDGTVAIICNTVRLSGNLS